MRGRHIGIAHVSIEKKKKRRTDGGYHGNPLRCGRGRGTTNTRGSSIRLNAGGIECFAYLEPSSDPTAPYVFILVFLGVLRTPPPPTPFHDGSGSVGSAYPGAYLDIFSPRLLVRSKTTSSSRAKLYAFRDVFAYGRGDGGVRDVTYSVSN